MSFIRYSYSQCRARECYHIISKLRRKKRRTRRSRRIFGMWCVYVCGLYRTFVASVRLPHMRVEFVEKCHYALTFTVFVFGDGDAALLFALNDAMCFVMAAFSLA